jgi:RNA polymerase sigma factor (sigma-70 family)
VTVGNGGEDKPVGTGSEAGSVTRWLGELKAGDPHAADELWKRYFRRLVGLAEGKLRKLSHPSARSDGEDVAQSAFYSLCEGVAAGRFDRLGDRDDLWRLLVVITSRKASDLRQSATRKKRGGGKVRGENELADPGAGLSGARSVWDQIPSHEPTPEFAAMLAEEYQTRLLKLGKEELRRIAVLRMEGYSNEEIAEKLGCALRTVARRLELIRNVWSDELPPP